MTNLESSHSQDKPSVEQVITDAISHPKVARHHKRMFEHGTKEEYPHESAYAIYRLQDGSIEPSRLVSANPHDHHDLNAGMTSVSLGELIDDSPEEAAITKEPEYTDIELRTIRGIIAAEELSSNEKEELVKKVREKAENRAMGVHTTGLRQDVPMHTHSHPLLSDKEKINELLMPSLADVEGHEPLHKANPGHVSAIVTSNGKDNAMLLYGAEVGREQDYHGYDDSNKRRNLRELGHRGFASAVILLGADGLPIEGQEAVVKDFARRVKTSK